MRAAGLFLALLLAACSAAPADPGAATPSEARQLDGAAAMLDANSVSPEALNAQDAR